MCPKLCFLKDHPILISVLCILLIALLYIIFRFKLFSKIVVSELSLGSGTLLFIPYKGSYASISGTIAEVTKKLSPVFGKDLKYFGIYYDNPYTLVNQNDSRAIVGVCLNSNENVKNFLEENSNFKSIEIKNLKGFGFTLPFYSFIDLFIAIVRGYPVLSKFGKETKLMDKSRCSIEFYDYSKKELTIAFAYYENNENILNQSGYPEPQMKNNFNNQSKVSVSSRRSRKAKEE